MQPDDVVLRTVGQGEATRIHEFNVSLGQEDKDFYRWCVSDGYGEAGQLSYHYVEFEGSDFRIEYRKSEQKKYVFTGNVVQVKTGNSIEFEDGEFG